MPKKAFKSLWDTVQKGQVWTGYVKNATKSGGYYWVFVTVWPFESCDGSNGYTNNGIKKKENKLFFVFLQSLTYLLTSLDIILQKSRNFNKCQHL